MITEEDIMVDRVIFDYLLTHMAGDYNTPLGKFLDVVELMTVRGYGAILTIPSTPHTQPRKIDFGGVKLPRGLTDKYRKGFLEWIAETVEERKSHLHEGDSRIKEILNVVRGLLN